MTLGELAGIKHCDIDVITGERLEHSEIYGRIISKLGGLDAVIPYIPFTLDEIKSSLKTDRHLNNLSMETWDRAAGFIIRGANCTPTFLGIWALYRKAGINSASCSEGVCILKEAARLWAARESECNT